MDHLTTQAHEQSTVTPDSVDAAAMIFDLFNQLDEVSRRLDRMTIHQINFTEEGDRLQDRHDIIRRKIKFLGGQL
jgi:hypothetical protein